MPESKHMGKCFFCGREFQCGPNRYDGKFLSNYKIEVCRQCYDANWDGWAPHYEEKLIAHLRQNNIVVPARNGNGGIPRD